MSLRNLTNLIESQLKNLPLEEAARLRVMSSPIGVSDKSSNTETPFFERISTNETMAQCPNAINSICSSGDQCGCRGRIY